MLVGKTERLRPMVEHDVVVRAGLGRSREIVRWFGGDLRADAPISEIDARAQLQTRFGPGPHWVIADTSDRFIGVTRLAPIDARRKSAQFAIGILDPDRLGQGLGTETTKLVVRYGFEHLALDMIELTVLADNARAIGAYAKNGFVETGRTRNALRRDGRWYDDLHMAIDASANITQDDE